MYERTYHKTVLKNDEPTPKKKSSINWKMVLKIFIGLIIVVGIVVLIRLPQWQVSHIEVTGENVVDPGDITQVVQNDLQGKKLFILPKTSIFLVPEGQLEKDLKSQFSRLQTVTVTRKNFSTITVKVTEYQGIYLWCSDPATCDFMDQNGVAFATAPYFSGDAYPKIFIGSAQRLPFQALNANDLIIISTALNKLPAIGIIPGEFHFVSEHELDIDFNHDGQQSMLVFDPTNDIDDAMNALYTGLRTDPLAAEFQEPTKVLQYIDLRFPNRVIYKFQ